MRVMVADSSHKVQKDKPAANNDEAKKKGTTAFRDRNKAIKKNEELNAHVSYLPTITCYERRTDRDPSPQPPCELG